MNSLHESANRALTSMGFVINRTSTINRMAPWSDLGRRFEILKLSLRESALDIPLSLAYETISESKSQIGQDIAALGFNGMKRQGYFVDIGAADGVSLSNTYLLETNFGWRGICSEPHPVQHKELRDSRNCQVDNRAVWHTSDHSLNLILADLYSAVDNVADRDRHARRRSHRPTVPVRTVSMGDLLVEQNAPQVIDYLTIDTEGSEPEIVQAIPFHQYKFNFISIEHNFGPHREHVRNLLGSAGYKPILEEFSAHDDWFISSEANPASVSS